jgi:F-type H+-transporting ATPase subunit alpha
MQNFKYYLDKVGEIGFVDQVVHSIAHVVGIPHVRVSEVVMFESGDLGQVLSLSTDHVEVILLTSEKIDVGGKVVRTQEALQIPVGEEILGSVIGPLGNIKNGTRVIKNANFMPVDVEPLGIADRVEVQKFLETGVGIVDLIVPLGKGQRELVIGDRKTGKTKFIRQSILTQAKKGTVCIYGAIAQRKLDIKRIDEFLKTKGIKQSTVIVATEASDPSGLIYIAPYTAMTIAEFFRDKGMDVLVILDDMTGHARVYREISLLAKRFPGRDSYPGDIFFIHSKLLERAGNFKKGSITCFPMAESIMGDLAGYIQTNLMAMTDGHLYFDIDLFNQGRLPAVSPFLSVTRVGRSAQTPLTSDISRTLTSFLVKNEKMKQFMHFGTEVTDEVRRTLDLGEKLEYYFDQKSDEVVPININIILVVGLWAGIWRSIDKSEMKKQMDSLILGYKQDTNYRKRVDQMVASANKFSQLIDATKKDSSLLAQKYQRS